MPAFYKIDKERRLVMSSASGVFTLADALSHTEKLSKDPDFDPGFSQIADFTPVTRMALSSDEIRRLAQTGIFSPQSRRAFIAPNETISGIGRMFEILRSLEGEKRHTYFSHADQVLDWVFPKSASA